MTGVVTIEILDIVSMGLFEYPIRDFRCPACGTKMETREYRALTPWVCRRCGEQLQFSRFYGNVSVLSVTVISFLFALLAYMLELPWWQSLVAGVVMWFAGIFVVVPALGKIIPPALERYRPLGSGLGSHSPTTLFPHGSPAPRREDGPSSAQEKEE